MNRRRALLAALIPLVVLAFITLDTPSIPAAEDTDVRTAALGDGNRQLFAGGNFVLYEGPSADVEDALNNIMPVVVRIWYFESGTQTWLFWDPTLPSALAGFSQLIGGEAYYVIVTQDITWEFRSPLAPLAAGIDLGPGTNIVGYSGPLISVADALGDAAADISVIWVHNNRLKTWHAWNAALPPALQGFNRLRPQGVYIFIATTSTALLQGRTIVVRNSNDNGSGTLRQALLDARPYDTITFDPAVFPPHAPATIAVSSALSQLKQGYLTIDASDAGVILDGSQLPRDSWIAGLEIVGSDRNTIRGLQVVNFTGTGLVIAGGRNNTIGGDRNIGVGPTGQGNLTSDNDFGIGIWSSASNNVVTGNLVGTDVSGTSDRGNQASGLWVTEGGANNVLGPDNIVAYNDRCGVEVDGFDALGNTLTRNSIHDNGGTGICLFRGGNGILGAPLILAFDAALRSVTGTSCVRCTVELFSDSGAQGAVFEGQAVADSDGLFTIANVAPINANLISTTTDAEGNTSGFSASAAATASVLLQEGNSLPKFRLLTRPSGELVENGIGMPVAGMIAPGGPFDIVRDQLIDFGAKRANTSLYEVEPPLDWSVPEYDIPPAFDRFVDDLALHGVGIDYILHFWDKAGHARGEELATPRFQSEEQVQDFLDYIRFIVGHFKGRVQYYTLWSEPDNCGQGGIKCVPPEDYIALARQVIPVIREEDPAAKIGLAPNVLFFARDDLLTVLRSDVIALFDVVEWHGQYTVTPDNEFYGDYYDEYPALIAEIKQTAAASGFSGEYWSTEMGWCAGPSCENSTIETGVVAAKYYARGYISHAGMDVAMSFGVNPEHVPGYATVRYLNTLMNGMAPIELAVDVETSATNIRSYAFVAPNGDTLFALWTDGVASEDDPGVDLTLAFSGLSAPNAVGIDVVNGFEQELIAEMKNGDLVIHDLLIKDYPIIVRLSD